MSKIAFFLLVVLCLHYIFFFDGTHQRHGTSLTSSKIVSIRRKKLNKFGAKCCYELTKVLIKRHSRDLRVFPPLFTCALGWSVIHKKKCRNKLNTAQHLHHIFSILLYNELLLLLPVVTHFFVGWLCEKILSHQIRFCKWFNLNLFCYIVSCIHPFHHHLDLFIKIFRVSCVF